MRTTIRIDDELLGKLKDEARKQNLSLTRLVDRTLRAGMQATRAPRQPRRRYRELTHSMGTPNVSLDKALALAGVLEDREILRKMMLRK